MAKIKSGSIRMKPRWYFILGSVLMTIGVLSLSVVAIFLLNLSFFLLRQHGPMGEWRIQMMINSFPWWIPLLAVVGILLGVLLLKKYDFSYKKNFTVIAIVFVTALIMAAFIVDASGINETWSRQARMRRLYQSTQERRQNVPNQKRKQFDRGMYRSLSR